MSFYKDHCIYLPAMLGWFLFSALLSSYNNWSLSAAFPIYFGGDTVATMPWKPYLSTSIPCGLVTSGDVGLSNLSLVRISITFYTMVKASTPIFVLGWAYLLGIERITWSLLGVVLVIALGEFLTVAGEVHFDMIGFAMCLSASLLSGARWTLVQLKLHTLDPPLKTTVATMRVLSPSMFFSMLVLSLCIEKPWIALSSGYFETMGQALRTFGLGMVGATFAVAMIICEFYLIMRASAIVLMIGGVIKEMITIIVGVEFFHDSLNRINVAGCLIVFSGVVLYKVSYHLDKHRKGHEEDDIVRYEHVENGEQQQSRWIESVDGELLNGEVKKTSLEMEAVGIQMGLPKVLSQDENEESDDEGSDNSIRHRSPNNIT